MPFKKTFVNVGLQDSDSTGAEAFSHTKFHIDWCIMSLLSLRQSPKSIILLKLQVSVTVTQGLSAVGVAGWPVMLTGWPVTVGVAQVRVFTLHTGAGWAW